MIFLSNIFRAHLKLFLSTRARAILSMPTHIFFVRHFGQKFRSHSHPIPCRSPRDSHYSPQSCRHFWRVIFSAREFRDRVFPRRSRSRDKNAFLSATKRECRGWAEV